MKRFKENSNIVHFGHKKDPFWSHCAKQQFFSKIRLCHFICIPKTKFHAKKFDKWLLRKSVGREGRNSIGHKISNACDQKISFRKIDRQEGRQGTTGRRRVEKNTEKQKYPLPFNIDIYSIRIDVPSSYVYIYLKGSMDQIRKHINKFCLPSIKIYKMKI